MVNTIGGKWSYYWRGDCSSITPYIDITKYFRSIFDNTITEIIPICAISCAGLFRTWINYYSIAMHILVSESWVGVVPTINISICEQCPLWKLILTREYKAWQWHRPGLRHHDQCWYFRDRIPILYKLWKSKKNPSFLWWSIEDLFRSTV